MRPDEHTVPASVHDGIIIQQLKQLHRQEIANLPAPWLGAIAGGTVALLFWGDRSSPIAQIQPEIVKTLARIFATILGVVFGAENGWIGQVLNETRYDWRYFSKRQKIILIGGSFLMICIVICVVIVLR